ncbi:hypothetical protein HMPREF0514_11612 [Lactobacillus paragasseri JV-V03]|uniref:Uncharacterized protein n=1 Tax=Lactobacillus paragasseri JV-V03 TaxID=525326 RepID=A0AA87DDH8_9LACO|nr:hypothetical protein HMPREF0514_11612 [Lactobacillus paragasseri JV-V03]
MNFRSFPQGIKITNKFTSMWKRENKNPLIFEIKFHFCIIHKFMWAQT